MLLSLKRKRDDKNFCFSSKIQKVICPESPTSFGVGLLNAVDDLCYGDHLEGLLIHYELFTVRSCNENG